MDSNLLDVMCASREYTSLGWKWTQNLPSIHVYFKILWKNRYKDDYERICNCLFAPIYGDWYMTFDGFYIIMTGSSKDPHWLPHFLPKQIVASRNSISNLYPLCCFFIA